MMAFGEVGQSFHDAGAQFDGMFGDCHRQPGDRLVQRGRDRFYRQPLKCLLKGVREDVQPVSMGQDAPALDLVQNLAHLLRRIFPMIQKRNKIRDCALEINIVFPQRVVGVNEKCLRAVPGTG